MPSYQGRLGTTGEAPVLPSPEIGEGPGEENQPAIWLRSQAKGAIAIKTGQ